MHTNNVTSEQRDEPAAEREQRAVEMPGNDDKKKKKKKYSRGLEDVQKMERRMSKAQRRVARAVSAGVDTWHKRTERSSKKKRDGAVRDALVNMASAHAASLRVASRLPLDVASGMRIKPKMWRQVLLFPFGND